MVFLPTISHSPEVLSAAVIPLGSDFYFDELNLENTQIKNRAKDKAAKILTSLKSDNNSKNLGKAW